MNTIGLLISNGAGIIYQFALARSLSPANIGVINLALTVIGLMGLLVLFGLDRAIVRFVSHYLAVKDRKRELGSIVTMLKIWLILVGVFLPITWIAAEKIAIGIFRKPDVFPILRIFILGLPFITLAILLMGVLQGYKLMKPFVLVDQIITPGLQITGAIIVIYLIAPNPNLIAYAYIFVACFECIIAIIIVRRLFVSRKKGSYSILIYPEVIRFSWPLLGASILNRTNTHIETLILGSLSTSEQIGLYTISLKVSITLIVFFQAINTIFTPFIVQNFAQNDLQKLSYQLKTVSRWIFTLSLPFALVMVSEARSIMRLINPQLESGTPVLRILTIGSLIYSLVGPAAMILTMTRYNHLNLFDLILTLLLSLILDFTFIPRFGALGAAIANSISIIFLNILRLGQVYYYFRIHPYSRNYFNPIIAGGFASLVLIAGKLFILETANFWQLVLLSGISFLIYGIALSILPADKTDKQLFNALIRKFTFQST